ncbi:MAG: hypothetical protein GY850_08720 [bacterium]|nr:hypothetical protein [bacterium]
MNLGVREKSDERILGGGEFVEQVLKEVDLANKYRLTTLDRQKLATRMVERGAYSVSRRFFIKPLGKPRQ